MKLTSEIHAYRRQLLYLLALTSSVPSSFSTIVTLLLTAAWLSRCDLLRYLSKDTEAASALVLEEIMEPA